MAGETDMVSIELAGEGSLDLATYLKSLTEWRLLLMDVAAAVAPESQVVLEVVELHPRGATVRVCAYPRRRRRNARGV